MVRGIERRLRSFVTELAFERRLRVDTAVTPESNALDYADDRFVSYEPAEWGTLRHALSKRSIAVHDVFADLGCGKGRMVLRAASYPFARVIGVELSHELITVARGNVEHNRGRLRCGGIELIQADVTAYELDDDVSVIFLNNPFTGGVFQAAVNALVRSLERRPRRVRVVYRHPMEHDRLMATGLVRSVTEWRKGAWRGRARGVAVRSYEMAPSA